MNLYKKASIVLFFLFFSLSSNVYCQTDNKETNAEYVYKLMKESKTQKIYMVAGNMHKDYSKEWLAYVEVKGEWIIFSKGDTMHRWNIKNTIFIEKFGDVIKVRMNEMIGE